MKHQTRSLCVCVLSMYFRVRDTKVADHWIIKLHCFFYFYLVGRSALILQSSIVIGVLVYLERERVPCHTVLCSGMIRTQFKNLLIYFAIQRGIGVTLFLYLSTFLLTIQPNELWLILILCIMTAYGGLQCHIQYIQYVL